MLTRKNGLAIALLASLFIVVHIPLVLRHIGHSHAWRQADTAAVSRNFYEESFNIMYPRVDVRGDLTGITGMEFPLYQYVTGFFYFIFDTGSDIPGKLVSLVCSIIVLLLLIALSGKIDGKITAPAVAVVFLSSPFVFYFSTAFMPEMFALSLALAGIYFFSHYEEKGLLKHLIMSILFFCLASLSRPFLAFLCYPLLERFLSDLKKRKLNWQILVGSLVVLFPFSFWYYYWAPHLTKQFGLDYFYFGSAVSHNVSEMLSLSFWRLLFTEVSQSYLNWIWLPFASYGAYKLSSRGSKLYRYFLLSSLIGIVALGLVSGTHFSPHYYYLVFILPFLIYSSAFSMSLLFDESGINFAVAGAVLILLFTVTKIRIYGDDKNFIKIKDNLTQIQQVVPKDSLVVVEDIGAYAYSLHCLRRRGWVVDKEQIRNPANIREYHENGAAWFIPLENGKSVLYNWQDWQKRLSQ